MKKTIVLILSIMMPSFAAHAEIDLRNSPNAIVILVHGLNTNVEKMNSLKESLERARHKVFVVALHGHRGSRAEMRRVTREQWLEDLYAVYQQARAEADTFHLPLIYMGYSLGGLMGLDLWQTRSLSENPIRYDKLVLLAPAMATHAWINFVLLIRGILDPKLIIPSLNKRAYAAVPEGTSIAAYSALFEAQHEVLVRDIPDPLIPAKIFIDPQDELVSKDGLQQFIEDKKLVNWTIEEIHKEKLASISIRHLILDSATLGPDVYAKMIEKINSFIDL